jgi:condensin complex subunit 2
MSLLKEGDGVNFQRASCTLDGCVKIYTNRVDSVATETNRLLTGLADSKNKDDEDGDQAGSDQEDGEDEDGNKKKAKKRAQRSAESTLASSFAQLQLKKMELEFAIDPLFKKASADFDEGGAKGLLLNHLSIDGTGRIVFDSSDDAQESPEHSTEVADEDVDNTETEIEPQPPIAELDIGSLAAKFFPDLNLLETQDICPSLKTFELGNGDASLDLPFLKAPEDWKQQSGEVDQQNNNATMLGGDDDDDNILGGFDLADDVGFGEGGEAWAREVALEPQMRLYNAGREENAYESDVEGDAQGENNTEARYAISMRHGANDEQQNILDYFDQALKSNWAGPEHWKIRKVKDSAAAANQAPTKRKEREPFEIDFLAPMSQQLADALYTPATSNATISLPKTQWKSKSRNLLPDDKHFSSRQLLRLFLKPNATLARKTLRTNNAPTDLVNVDEEYWARQQEAVPTQDGENVQGNYDANFFQDDGFNLPADDDDDGDEFADAREHFTPEADAIVGAAEDGHLPRPGSQDGAYGAQLVTQSRRLRPEYVQYARVATKVDVRRLKEEIWKGLEFEQVSTLWYCFTLLY